MNGKKFLTHNLCAKCRIWVEKPTTRCPICGRKLRTVPVQKGPVYAKIRSRAMIKED